jgi:hypothetical protein
VGWSSCSGSCVSNAEDIMECDNRRPSISAAFIDKSAGGASLVVDIVLGGCSEIPDCGYPTSSSISNADAEAVEFAPRDILRREVRDRA